MGLLFGITGEECGDFLPHLNKICRSRPIYNLEIMVDKEAKSRDLQSFAEERSINNEASSRPLSQRRNPPRYCHSDSG